MPASKYDDKTVAGILDLLRRGNTIKQSAASHGIGETTIWEWRKRYPEFDAGIMEAEAIAESGYLSEIRSGARTDWRAAAWWLERRHHAQWRERKSTEVTGAEGEAVQVRIIEAVKPEDA